MSPSSSQKAPEPSREELMERIAELENEDEAKNEKIAGLMLEVKVLETSNEALASDNEKEEVAAIQQLTDQARRFKQLSDETKHELRKMTKERNEMEQYKSIFINRSKFRDAALVLEIREFERVYTVKVTSLIARDVKAPAVSSMNLFEVKRIVEDQKPKILQLLSMSADAQVPEVDEETARHIVSKLDGDVILGLDNLFIALMNKSFAKLSFDSFVRICVRLEKWNDELNDFIHEGRPSLDSLKKGLELVKERSIFPSDSSYIKEMEQSFDDYDPTSTPVRLPKSQDRSRFNTPPPRKPGQGRMAIQVALSPRGRGDSTYREPPSRSRSSSPYPDNRSRDRNVALQTKQRGDQQYYGEQRKPPPRRNGENGRSHSPHRRTRPAPVPTSESRQGSQSSPFEQPQGNRDQQYYRGNNQSHAYSGGHDHYFGSDDRYGRDDRPQGRDGYPQDHAAYPQGQAAHHYGPQPPPAYQNDDRDGANYYGPPQEPPTDRRKRRRTNGGGQYPDDKRGNEKASR